MPQPIQGVNASAPVTDAFNLNGKLPMQLDEIIVPVVNVGDLGEECVWGPRAQSTLYLPAGGAANNSKFELALPVTNEQQGIAAKVEELYVQTAAAAAANLNILPSPGIPVPTHFGVTNWCDLRTRGLPQVQLAGKNDSVPSALPGVYRRRLAANEYCQVPAGWILGQNPDTGVLQGLYVEFAALNVNAWVTAVWRERLPR